MTNEAERVTETWGYTGKRAAEIVGITYRQLDYWARTDLIRPSVADAAGSGSRRSYSYQDHVRVIGEDLVPDSANNFSKPIIFDRKVYNFNLVGRKYFL